MVLFILAAMWGAVLLPPWLRNRSATGGRDSVGQFRNQLNVLARTYPGAAYRPATRIDPTIAPHGARLPTQTTHAQATAVRSAAMPSSSADAGRRRRDILRVLAAGAAITFIAWLITGARATLLLNLVLDGMFLAYATLVFQQRRISAERASKLRYLPEPVHLRSSEEQSLLRRSGS